MAIEWVTGDIFDSDAEALVNPVNTAGRMGRAPDSAVSTGRT